METNKRDHLGIPEENILPGYDYEIFEASVNGKGPFKKNGIHYLNLDYQGPLSADKVYAQGLIMGGELMANGCLFATNFLAAREYHKGENYKKIRIVKAISDLHRTNNGNRFIRELEEIEDSTSKENRDEAITRNLLAGFSTSISNLELIEPVKYYFDKIKSKNINIPIKSSQKLLSLAPYIIPQKSFNHSCVIRREGTKLNDFEFNNLIKEIELFFNCKVKINNFNGAYYIYNSILADFLTTFFIYEPSFKPFSDSYEINKYYKELNSFN